MKDRLEIGAGVFVRIPSYRFRQVPEVAVLLEERKRVALYVQGEVRRRHVVGRQVAFEQPRSRRRFRHEIPKLQSPDRTAYRSTEAGERLVDLMVQHAHERPEPHFAAERFVQSQPPVNVQLVDAARSSCEPEQLKSLRQETIGQPQDVARTRHRRRSTAQGASRNTGASHVLIPPSNLPIPKAWMTERNALLACERPGPYSSHWRSDLLCWRWFSRGTARPGWSPRSSQPLLSVSAPRTRLISSATPGCRRGPRPVAFRRFFSSRACFHRRNTRSRCTSRASVDCRSS